MKEIIEERTTSEIKNIFKAEREKQNRKEGRKGIKMKERQQEKKGS